MVLASASSLNLLPLILMLLAITTMSLPVLAFPSSLLSDFTSLYQRQTTLRLRNRSYPPVLYLHGHPRVTRSGTRSGRDLTSDWGLRLLWPCAGRRRYSDVIRPDVGLTSLAITPMGVLLRLSSDAAAARRQVQLLRMRFESSRLGGIPPKEALFYYSLHQPKASHDHPVQLADLLTTTYVRLARAVRQLSDVRQWETTTHDPFSIDMDHIIEHNLLNLMCGTKVVLGSLDHPLNTQTLEGALQHRLHPPTSTALRYLAQFRVLASIEYLLGEVRVVFRNIAV